MDEEDIKMENDEIKEEEKDDLDEYELTENEAPTVSCDFSAFKIKKEDDEYVSYFLNENNENNDDNDDNDNNDHENELNSQNHENLTCHVDVMPVKCELESPEEASEVEVPEPEPQLQLRRKRGRARKNELEIDRWEVIDDYSTDKTYRGPSTKKAKKMTKKMTKKAERAAKRAEKAAKKAAKAAAAIEAQQFAAAKAPKRVKFDVQKITYSDMVKSKATCNWCINYFAIIASYHKKPVITKEFFVHHEVLSSNVICPKCGKQCTYSKDCNVWACANQDEVIEEANYCSYQVESQNNKFLSQFEIEDWKVILFVNHFLHHTWDHKTIKDCLDLSNSMITTCTELCGAVCKNWEDNQPKIGGKDSIVDINESDMFGRKTNDGKPTRVCILMGVERQTRKHFAVSLVESGTNPLPIDAERVVPIIQKYVAPETTVITNSSQTYITLNQYGYTHKVYEGCDDKSDNVRATHVQNIVLVWRYLRDLLVHDISAETIQYYLLRFNFIKNFKNHPDAFHNFFLEATKFTEQKE